MYPVGPSSASLESNNIFYFSFFTLAGLWGAEVIITEVIGKGLSLEPGGRSVTPVGHSAHELGEKGRARGHTKRLLCRVKGNG